MIAMYAVNCQDGEDRKIRNKNEDIEAIQMVQAIPMVDRPDLVKPGSDGRDDHHHKHSSGHLMRMSVANVSSSKILM